MKKVMELLKKELGKNWRSELDALSMVFGLREVQTGKSTYYSMTCDEFELYVSRGKVLGDEYIRVKVTVYEDFEERSFRISTNLFDRFVTALENYARETEKDRFLNRYKYEVMRRRDDDPDSDKKY